MTEHVIGILIGLTVWVLLPVLYYTAYHNYRVSLLRYRIFLIRDRLFLAWADSGIGYDHRSYVLTRTLCNGILRFGHKVSLIECLIWLLMTKREDRQAIGEEYGEAWGLAKSRLPVDLCNAVKQARLEVHLALLSHFVHTSLPCFLVISVLQFVIPSLNFQKVAGSMEPSTWDSVDGAIVNVEAPRELAAAA